MGLVYISTGASLKLRWLARLLVIVLVAALVAQLGGHRSGRRADPAAAGRRPWRRSR